MAESLRAFLKSHGASFTAAERAGSGPGEDGAKNAMQPSDYGNFDAEVEALQNGLGLLIHETCDALVVRGPDAATFLDGLTTSKVPALSLGSAQESLLCANKGKILHHLVLVRAGDDQLLVIGESGEGDEIARRLNHFHVREELELGRVELARVDLIGPQGGQALESLGFKPEVGRGTYADNPLIWSRLPLGNRSRWLTLLPPQAVPAWGESLLATSQQARLVGFDAYEEARILAGVARYGVDYGTDHLPAEAALYNHISFDKGCYGGQEIHARMHYRGHPNRKLTAVIVPHNPDNGLAAGSDLFLNGDKIGVLTSLGRVGEDGARHGIAMVNYRVLQESSSLSPAPGTPPEISLHPLTSDLGSSRA